ncbi:MAG: transcription elongation factor GreA [Caldithrix sp.]|nr:transcription elongation factor GreA [Caldithrix sp.]
MMEYVYLTQEGLNKLKEELHDLKYKQRPKVSQKVATARDHGDLKENAEYHAAREELSMIESKVQQLQDRIARARLLDEDEIDNEHVTILNTVEVEDQKSGKTFTYTLVSAEETNIKEGKISISSPVGKGLLKKKVGEIAEIQAPRGVLKYKIVTIK